jgi:hypothetical protein
MSFITTRHSLWQKALLIESHDVYHLPGYCQLEAEVLQGIPMAWTAQIEGVQFVIPLVERVIQSNGSIGKDLVSPYGYPGILYPVNTAHSLVNKALKRFYIEAAESNYISSFIRLHPIYNEIEIPYYKNISQHAHGSTVAVNLIQPISSIRNNFSKDHKRNLKRLHKDTYQVVVNNWDQLPDFITLYTQTMKRKHAQPRYFFSVDYFKELKNILSRSLFLVTVLDANGDMAAGGLFTLCNGLSQFHLSGTADDFIKQSPSRLMMDGAIEALKEQGSHTLHLGGGFGSSNTDGLFIFKSGFGHKLHKFNTLRFIHLPDKYNQLLQSSADINKNPAAYFPEYRFLKS